MCPREQRASELAKEGVFSQVRPVRVSPLLHLSKRDFCQIHVGGFQGGEETGEGPYLNGVIALFKKLSLFTKSWGISPCTELSIWDITASWIMELEQL